MQLYWEILLTVGTTFMVLWVIAIFTMMILDIFRSNFELKKI